MPRILECEQGTPEWHIGRAGLITASMESTIRRKLKTGPNAGGYTQEAEKYAFRLALERIMERPLDDTYETEYMRRGRRLEDDARDLHESLIGDFIEQIGLIVSDCGRFGASADGLIRHDGGAEYKAFVDPGKLMPILIHGDVSEIQGQMQMNLWLSGRDWWHFGLYCPGMAGIGRDLTIIPVERDNAYIEAMVADLQAFDVVVEDYRQRILESNYHNVTLPELKVPAKPAPQPAPEPEEEIYL